MPVYNGERTIAQAIESVLKQTYTDWEIIVIDDGSTDDTRKIVERYRSAPADRIRYIHQENQGLACARNTGIRQARGEFLALLDADDVWLPTRLEETVKALDADPSAGIAHANITWISETGEILSTPRRQARHLSGYIFENIFLRKAHISCPTVLFRKKCCEEVGMFDPNLARLGCEDRELWLRISQRHKVRYIDKVLALYRVSASSMSRNQEKMLRARLYVVDKFCPANGPREAIRQKALAKIYRDLGDEFLLTHDFAGAKKNYRQAIAHAPFSFWAWMNLGKSLLRVRT